MKNAEDLTAFLHLVRARLEKGSEAYGETSFERHPPDLLQEIVEELADVCGWSAVLATRIYQLQRKARGIKDTAYDDWIMSRCGKELSKNGTCMLDKGHQGHHEERY